MPKVCFLMSALPVVFGGMVTTKRTQSSRDGRADEDFFNTYFGVHDSSSTYSACLDRNLAQMLPARVGMHFPNSTTVETSADNHTLGAWQLRNLEALGSMSAYHGLMDWATVFYVPDLSPHIKQFKADGVGVMQRSYVDSNNVDVFVAIVHTNGSGHVLELQSTKCSACSKVAFGKDECAIGHKLPRDMSFYAEAWKNASTDTTQWSTVGPAALPAPMVVSFKQISRDLDPVENLYKELMPASRNRSDSDCETLSTGPVGVGPFGGGSGTATLPDYPLEFLFVHNKARSSEVKPFLAFLDQLHDERVGFGWGWDRSMDFHTKLTDSSTFGQETKPGVSLDHWASLLTEHRIKFATFNLSQFCDGSEADAVFPPGGMGDMIYSAGPAHMGIEFWGKFNYSFYSPDKPAFFWGGVDSCSPTFDCRAYLSPPDCKASSPESNTIRKRVAANPPSNSAYAMLDCGNDAVIDGIRLATFGTATGTCETGFQKSPSCSRDITSFAQTICIGQRSCNVPASTALFGVPCNSSLGWWTTVEATCTASVSDTSEKASSLIV